MHNAVDAHMQVLARQIPEDEHKNILRQELDRLDDLKGPLWDIVDGAGPEDLIHDAMEKLSELDDEEEIPNAVFHAVEGVLREKLDGLKFGDNKDIIAAVKTLLEISKQESKLTGLDQTDAAAATTQVLVVGGSQQDYVQALKDAIDEPKAIGASTDQGD